MIPTSFYLNVMDPGATTGLGLIRVSPENYQLIDTATKLYRIDQGITPLSVLKRWNTTHAELPHVLLYEDFHVRPRSAIPDVTALNVIHDVKIWSQKGVKTKQDPPESPCPPRGTLRHADEGNTSLDTKPGKLPYVKVERRQPVQGKHLANDDVLKRCELTARNKHIRDALRHAVSWLASRGYRPLCERSWPRRS